MIKAKTYLDPSKINQNETIKTDVCIVGGGAAGISLALEFSKQKFNVLIIESGDKKFKHRNQHLSSSKSVGIPTSSIMFSRRRQFGGTTVTWAGRCRPLDEIDFIKKDWVPFSGWPFSKDELDPYYKRSQKVFGLDDYNYSFFSEKSDDWFDKLSNKTDFSGKAFLTSSSINFSIVHSQELEKSPNIKILLNTNVTHVNLDSSGKEVNSLTCKTIQGKRFFVSSSVFILAAGALEITKLLLSSNQVQKNGVGNQNDLVGRFYMDHAHFWSGAFINPTHKLSFGKENIQYFGKQSLFLRTYLGLGLKEKYIENEKLTNAAGFFIHRSWNKSQDEYYSIEGIAFQNIYDILRHYKYPDIKLLIKNIFILIKNIMGFIHYSVQYMTSIWEEDDWVGIHSQFEQVPNPESRITLSSTKNELGQANIIINWKLTSQDFENMNIFHSKMKMSFEKIGLSFKLFPINYENEYYPNRLIPGKHHMGTTRMNNDPNLGVVDENCKIHGVSNLYVASSSVFPTSGQANPTMTIVALAIKLADHIKNSCF